MHEANEIHVLGIVGSPRRNSNTEILVDEVLSGAAKAGAQIGKVILSELDINPCDACDRCRDSQSCAKQDDMAPVLELMNQSQIWILGTPIYWWGPSAQMKTFIDRWYGARHAKFQKRNVILTLPLGGGNERYVQPTVDMFKYIMNYLNMNHFATIVAPGVYRRGVVSEKTKILAAAHQTGIDAVESLLHDDYDSLMHGFSINPPSGSTITDSE